MDMHVAYLFCDTPETSKSGENPQRICTWVTTISNREKEFVECGLQCPNVHAKDYNDGNEKTTIRTK